MIPRRATFWLALMLAVATLAAFPAAAQQVRPLLAPGKSTVYQRVLTRPGAYLHSMPNGPQDRMYPAFQPLYVFDRQAGWLSVGASASRLPEGWVEESAVLPWKQNIVGAFTNSAGRKRQLFFDTEDHLRWLMNNEALTQVQDRLLAEAEAGLSGGDGVVSVEPEEFVNIRDDLYVMPILDFEQDLSPINYDTVLLMEVASVPLEEPAAAPAATTQTSDPFDVGIVFVLDTTQSMAPYIARTQKALDKVISGIEGTDIGKLVNFGVFGFRDSTDAVPGLEYRTRELIPLARRDDQTPVLDAIGKATRVATVSSPGFNEDSLAGVEDAIGKSDWDQDGNPINARYVILVTDAGPKDPRDPNARSEIGAAELQVDAEGQQIVVMTLHLRTPVGGEANHAYAADQYKALSRFGDNSFYFPIENGSETAFEDVATRLVTALTDHVRVARGEATELSDDEAGKEMVELGRAMRLAYLGDQRGTQAPDVIRGWVSDLAVEDPRRTAIEPRLLITKNELATMADLLRVMTDEGEKVTSSDDAMSFFVRVREVVAQMAQDPKMMVDANADSLGGTLEFLEDLPYQSQLMSMTEQRWGQSAMMRRTILDTMRQKLAQYRKWLLDPTVWTSLSDNSPDGEHVFAMPFDILP
ncbi:vWA domain-containing protein [Tropicimonas sp. IMCC34043]|uniref:vWA domain-containing protein n=1 Tax=Tropicimonas sp. IMCC34043 TaxID=2248760 RepID=UPI001E505533|nr:vWA domain-containing protein [Tropicimonas sp. IMCC34043]